MTNKSKFNYKNQSQMNFTLQGRVYKINETEKVSDTFKKRTFIVEIENERNKDWNDFVTLQTVQDKTEKLDSIKTDDLVKVSFNLRGRKYNKEEKETFFNSLDAYKIEKIEE